MKIRIAILIPLYNHGKTIDSVVERVRLITPDVFVLNDGSTDRDPASLNALPCTVLHQIPNQGKGAAVCEGAKVVSSRGFTHMITIDADGQHFPEDLPRFFEAIHRYPAAFIVGARDFSTENVPRSSRFGRSFSCFWCFVQTGVVVHDMQSGYRCYPLHALLSLSLRETRYAFEIEVLVRAAWAGFEIYEIPVRVFYPRKAERVSHFNSFWDNVRISLLNTRLTVRAMTPVPFRCLARKQSSISLRHPLQSISLLLQESSPKHLAFSAAAALFLRTLPILGIPSILILFAIHTLHLNRLCALSVVPISWLPFIPACCVFLGYYLRHGRCLTEFTVQTFACEAHLRFLEWILGSLILAPFFGVLLGAVVYIVAKILANDGKKVQV